jgi:hypothetical protein
MKFCSVIFLILWPAVTFALVPTDSINCNLPEAHQFDFWIGNWDIQQKIIQKDGTWINLKASTSVIPILGGCALEEHWEGDIKYFWEGMEKPKPVKGFSLRYFQPSSGKWYIRWMDTKDMNLGEPFTGNFSAGKGEFFSERETKRGKQISRITFSDIKENFVHWDLAVSNDKGKTWNTIWIMEMKRKEN